MSAIQESFQVDNIHSSILDLQDVNTNLEQKLNEVRNKRRTLERKCDNVLQRHKQLSEKHSKMHETVKIAHHKVNQSQSQIQHQQRLADEKQERINEMNEMIKQEQDQQFKELDELQAKLEEMSAQFHHARQFYSEENLSAEINLMNRKKKEINEKALETTAEINDLGSRVDNLTMEIERQEESIKKEDFHPEQQLQIYKMFEVDREITTMELQALRATESELKTELERLNSELSVENTRIEE